MKKVLLAAAAAMLFGLTFLPAVAQDDGEKKFSFDGMVRTRWDYFNNYFDLKNADSSGDFNDDAASLYAYRAMLGMTGNFAKNVSAHVDLQYIGFWGDEMSPQKDFFPPIGQWCGYLGQGCFGSEFGGLPHQGVQLYQGYIDLAKIGGSDFSVRIGRQEHTYGTELFLGDNDYYGGTSFDGLRGTWKHGGNDLNLFYYVVAEGNTPFGPFGGSWAASQDSNFFGVTYDYNFAKTWGTVGGYVLVNQDHGGLGPLFAPDSKLYTIGARWNKGMATGGYKGGDMFDWNIEVASQTGDYLNPTGGPKFDIAAGVGEGWFGWNFGNDKNHGRLHVGSFWSSGDKFDPNDPNDRKIEDFVPLYGDFHANNRLGDLDFVESMVGPHNITDINLGFEYWLGNHNFMLAAHKSKFTEKSGLFLTEDDIGTEIDLKYGFKYSKNVSFEVAIGELMPGKGLEQWFEVTNSDNVERAAAQVKLSW